MKAYYVEYRVYPSDSAKGITVIAANKADAYDKAMYEIIPETESFSPYSAWVSSVTYNNGNYKVFNNFEGNPY